MWRLTQTQLRNSLQDLFGFSGAAVDSLPAESRLEGFDNTADRLGVPSLLLDRYNTLAEEVASEAVRRHQSLLPCPTGQAGPAGQPDGPLPDGRFSPVSADASGGAR